MTRKVSALAEVEPVDVALVAMPWHSLKVPSIQLGVVKALLEDARITNHVAYLNLAFFDYFATRDSHEGFTVGEYEWLGNRWDGLNEWMFAAPPVMEYCEELARAQYRFYLSQDYGSLVQRLGGRDRWLKKILAVRRETAAFINRCADDILARQPSVVGLTVTHFQVFSSLAMAKVLKSRRPDLPIVLGGVGCRGEIGEALLRHHDWIDVVVRGEAELVVPGVFEELLAGEIRSHWPGLCLRDENGIVINPEDNLNLAAMTKVPMPNFDEYFEALADSRARGTWSPQILYEGARGCWWGHKHPCVFCGLNGPNPRFRAKPAAQVFEELQDLVARYECPEVRFVEPIMDMAHMRELWPRVRDSDLDLSVYCEIRPDLGRQALEVMRDAGFKRINPGIESFSNPILRLLKKGTTALVNIRLLKWAAEMDLDVGWNFLFGVPKELPEEYARMADLMLSLTHLKPPIAACPVTLHKNSPMYADPAGLGIKGIEPPMSYRLLFDLEDEHLRDLTFWFTYEYADDRRLESYVKPAIEAVNLWQGLYPSSYRSLTYLRGPGFIEIHDRRTHLRRKVYRFGELEAQLYLACDGGPRLETLWQSISDEERGQISLDEVKGFLDDLVRARLAYAEDDRYLSLAIPGATP